MSLKRILTSAVTTARILGILAAGSAVLTTSAASAATTSAKPVIYAAGLGWHFGSVKPYAIVIGGTAAGTTGAVQITDGVFPMRWLDWTSTRAYGEGKSETSLGNLPCDILLYGVKTHDGADYFSEMLETFPGTVYQWFRWTGTSWHFDGGVAI
jgi:hypothetical protein